MRRRLPNTLSLTIFEVVARHQNISRAAIELCMTESAVSRQISGLEDYLGVELFTRTRGRLQLSEPGRQYADDLAGVLDHLERLTLDLTAHRQQDLTLRVASIPTFANKWLIPRLKGYMDAHKEVTVDVFERATPFMFDGEPFDVIVHYDDPRWAGVRKVHLFDEAVVPIISPKHFDLVGLRSPADLAELPLLHKTIKMDCWSRWFENAGYGHIDTQAGPRYELYSTMIEGVKAGLGCALVPRMYIGAELETGSLAIPFDIPLNNEKNYCLILPDGKPSRPVEQFMKWICDEVAYLRAA